MCGLFGAKNSVYLSSVEQNVVTRMGYISIDRGEDSTGLGVLVKRNKQHKGRIYKSTLPSGPFLYSTKTKEWLKENQAPMILMGHTRAATKGGITYNNAQPYVSGSIVGMHNGTIDAFYDEKSGYSDSKFFIDMIAKEGIKAALEKAYTTSKAAFAVIWFDVVAKKIYMIRNLERPLWLQKSRAGSSCFWASERRILEWGHARNTVNLHDPVLIDTGYLYSSEFDSGIWSKEYLTVKKSYIPPKQEFDYSRYGSKYNADSEWWQKELNNQDLQEQQRRARAKWDNKFQKVKKKGKQDEPIDNLVILGPEIYKGDYKYNKTITPNKDEKRTYLFYRDNAISIESAEAKLQVGCYGCGYVPKPEETTYWKNMNDFICGTCLKGGYLRYLEGFNPGSSFEDLYIKSKILVA